MQRSASMGRDVAFLTDELHKRYEITRRRAEFIARPVQQGDRGHQAGAGQRARHHRRHLVHVPEENEPPYPPDDEREKFVITEGLYDSDVKRKVLCGELPGANVRIGPSSLNLETSLCIKAKASLDAAPSQRETDENGFLHVGASHITKATVNPYYGRRFRAGRKPGLTRDCLLRPAIGRTSSIA